MAKPPSGSSSSGNDPRPRAQVAYEGEDEFSAMSLDPSRRRRQAKPELDPAAPGHRPHVQIDDGRQRNGFWSIFRKIFDK